MLPVPLPERAATELRDELIDRLRTESFDEIVRKYVDAVVTPDPAADPATRRVYGALAAVHSRQELTRLARRDLDAILAGRPAEAAGDVAVAGGFPWGPVLVGAALGVGGSVVANYLYDEFVADAVTINIDLDGRTLEVTIHPNGSVTVRYVDDGESQ